jgi:hypothetical protein
MCLPLFATNKHTWRAYLGSLRMLGVRPWTVFGCGTHAWVGQYCGKEVLGGGVRGVVETRVTSQLPCCACFLQGVLGCRCMPAGSLFCASVCL